MQVNHVPLFLINNIIYSLFIIQETFNISLLFIQYQESVAFWEFSIAKILIEGKLLSTD